MSSNLYWEPIPTKRTYLNTAMKFVLQNRVGNPIDANLTTEDIPYLEGVRDAGGKELEKSAIELIRALENHR